MSHFPGEIPLNLIRSALNQELNLRDKIILVGTYLRNPTSRAPTSQVGLSINSNQDF